MAARKVKTPAKKKETSKKTSTAVAVKATGNEVGEALDLFQQDAGCGMENVEASDMAIPFILLLQALSPQLRGATKVDGAEEGMLYNTVTGKVCTAQHVIPCAFSKAWVEWVPRDEGGGFVAQHATDALLTSTTRNDKNQDILPNGNLLVQTAYHSVLLVERNGTTQRAIIAMTRTQLKVSRKWNSRMKEIKLPSANGLFTPPSFSHVYELSSIDEEKKGNTFKNFSLSEPIPIKSAELYVEARNFNREVMKGLINIAPPVDESVEPELNDTKPEDNNF